MTPQRAIRVFVSSTFRDMQAEREELIKRTFPQLRSLCEARGVTWTEVDLRWGVTDEQKADGEVLPICLEEIRRSRPYFIGILGARYGWIVDNFDPSLLAREPWLATYRGRSVTEIEMASGVLDNPEMDGHAFFYFRDPAASAAIALPGPADAAETSAKLNMLKTRIRAAHLPLHESFRSPVELADFVIADFTALIDRLFPEGSSPDPLDREAALHAAYASQRARVFVGRFAHLNRLDAEASGDGPPLVVTGASGVGKSALLASWASRFRDQHPGTFVFTHFIGASPASSDWSAIARRLIGELNRSLGMTIAAPDDATALRQALAEGLRMAGAVRRLVIVLDGLDQLEDRQQAPDLIWLPMDLPRRVRLVASTLAGRALDEIGKRGWQTLALGPLEPDDRRELIAAYLAQFAKALGRDQVKTVAAAALAGNPLFLIALLEELRIWGEHETLPAQIAYYLEASDIVDLFDRILERYEKDYERDRPGLVRDAFTSIVSGRHGLAEAELLDLLGAGGAPLPRAHWSPLFLAAERFLVVHSGLLGTFHAYLKQAVGRRYLPDLSAREAAHLRLADYFARRNLSARKIAELPWQLERAGRCSRLATLLGDLDFLHAANAENAADVFRFWAAVADHIPDAPLAAYQAVLDDPGRHLEALHPVSRLLIRLGFAAQSGRLQSALFQLMEQLPDFDARAFVCLCVECLESYRRSGETETAASIIAMAVDAARRRGDAATQAMAIGNEATFWLEQGKTAQALPLFEEAESLTRQAGDKALLADLLNNRAIVVSRSNPCQALPLLREVERIGQETGNVDVLNACLGNQGQAFLRLGDFEKAQAKYRAQETHAREIGSLEGIQSALNGQAVVLAARRDNVTAIALLEEQTAICRRLQDKKKLAGSLLLQASLRSADPAQIATAIANATEQQAICRILVDDSNLAHGLCVYANLLAMQKDEAGALGCLSEADAIYRREDDKPCLATCLAAQAQRYEAMRRFAQATKALKEAEALYRETGNVEGQARAIFDQARLFFICVRMPSAAVPDMRRAQALAERHGLTPLAQAIQAFADSIVTPMEG